MSLATLLPAGATAHPDRPCLVDVDRSYTWAEANDAVGRLAAGLRQAGVGWGDRVGVHHHKSAAAWLAMHAVVRLGAVAVPLDPGAPAARLRSICTSLDIAVVATHDPRARALGEWVADARVAVVGVSAPVEGAVATITADDIDASAPVDPVDCADADPAYIITTSGSTGEPKGIVHTHGSGMAYAVESAELYGLGPDDRVADTAPNHFDQSTFALWSALVGGSTVVVMPEPYQRMPASYSQRLADEGVTVWYGVPFLLQQLVLRGDLDNRDLSALRWVKFGGEVPPPSVIASMLDHAPNATMANIYGPAECNQCSFFHLDEARGAGGVIPIGVPTPSASMRLGDPEADRPHPAPVVGEGEIWVAGPTLMEGYAGLPEANAAKLVDVDGTRWYRTGDLGRLDEDGTWWFLGRVDHQVKVRGHRVELEAVEAELETLPGVEHAVAAVHRPGDGEDVVVAGVFPLEGFDADAFRAAARGLLPAYASPDSIFTISGKEFTGSGKLNRAAHRAALLDRVQKEGSR